jgi:hypothetical protein
MSEKKKNEVASKRYATPRSSAKDGTEEDLEEKHVPHCNKRFE